MCIQALNTENPLRIKITPSPVTPHSFPSLSPPPSPPSLCHWWWMLPVLQTEKGIDCSLCAFHSNLELSIDTHTHNCVKLSCLYQTTCLTHQRQRESETPGEHTNSNQSEKFVQTVPSWIWCVRVLIVFLETLETSFFSFQISCLDTFNTSGLCGYSQTHGTDEVLNGNGLGSCL